MADPTQQMQQPGMMGYGVNPQQQLNQWALAAALSQGNDSGLVKDMMTADQPQGRMVGDRFVAPSWTQHLAGAVNQGIGAMAYRKNMELKKDFMQQMQANALAQQQPNPTLANNGAGPL